MVNEIKFDTINPAVMAKSSQKDAKVAAVPPVKVDEQTVTNSLGTLVNKLMAENGVTESSKRVIELKDKIANHEYKVDLDTLATKLTHTILNAK